METVLVVSQRRSESAENAGTARLLAKKFNVKVLDIPLVYDFPSGSPVIERLRSLPVPAYFFTPLSCRSVKSMLTHLKIPFADVFETADSVQIPDGGVPGGQVERIDESPQARWYPIIDDSKCSACLECVNYCLFGVYAIGADSRPFVDQPDACRDGCPACSRVCPGKAIMFPLYEDRSIAGFEQPLVVDMDMLVDIVDQI